MQFRHRTSGHAAPHWQNWQQTHPVISPITNEARYKPEPLMKCGSHTFPLAIALSLLATTVRAQSAEPDPAPGDLARQLQNPVANLITVPIESNWEFGIGPARSTDYFGAIKPVIPFPLGANWHVITRTILPFSYSVLLDRGASGHVGVGDAVMTAYLSPTKSARGWSWGLGPGLVLPSATDDGLGSGKWSAGPTGAVIKQRGPWTFIALVGQAWSFAGRDNRERVNTTVLQPSLAYTTERDTTLGIGISSAYNWTADLWALPLEVSASQLLHVSSRAMSLGLTVRSHLDRPESGPNWGLVFTAAFLFPKRL
jgi:hypothetical protein